MHHIASTLPALTSDEALLESRFLARGGVIVLQGLFDDAALAGMRQEAAERRPQARRWASSGSGSDEWRGGDPARAYWGASGGAAQWAVLALPATAEALSDLCGLPIRVTGGGSYSYYSEPGDFLALHRDIVRCDLALLTCLEETASSTDDQGVLRAYPAHAADPLASIRVAPNPVRVAVPLRPGQSALLLGGIVAHEVTPMATEQRRTMSVACFGVVSD